MPGVRAESTDAMASVREPVEDGARLLFDLSQIDLSQRLLDREALQSWIPHRGQMQLLDAIVWIDDAKTMAVGHRLTGPDEFWVEGHFPGKPMFPGVLMVETGAQLALYVFNIRRGAPQLPAFLRIEECVFRHQVEPGDDFFTLCKEVKVGKRRFISDVQGMVRGKVAFQARVVGMSLGEWSDAL